MTADRRLLFVSSTDCFLSSAMTEIIVSKGSVILPVLELIETSEKFVLRFLLPSTLDDSMVRVSVDENILRVYAKVANER